MPARRFPFLLLTAALAACGGSSAQAPTGADSSPPGDIPDNQAFVTYAPPGARFSVKVPEGWAQSSHTSEVRFTDKLNTIDVAWGARIPSAPAAAKASAVKRKAGTARRLTYTLAGRPDPVTGKTRTDAVERYEFTHAGRRVVVTLIGPRGADNVDPWRIVTDSLRWR